jgi:transcriptional regulator with XRE-family HTH domain
MSTHRTTTLSDRVADEIRGLLGRRRMSASELARRLKVSRSWVSLRLTGAQEIGLNDLERIAFELDTTIGELLHLEAGDIPPEQAAVVAFLDDESYPPEMKGLFLRVQRRLLQEVKETPAPPPPAMRSRADARR